MALPLSAQQLSSHFFWHDNIQREYSIYVPAAYDGSQAVPLLFNLHGYGSNKDQQDFYGDFKAIADTANFLICLPNGTFDSTGSRFWNVGFGGATIDDAGFLMSLLDSLSQQYHIDPARVYSTGMSNGGFMSFTLACEQANRVAAIASVTGSITYTQQNNCTPPRPVPVMQIHGTADPTVPYNGTNFSMPIDDVITHWIAHNNCNATPIETPIPDINTTDNCTTTRFDYGGCDENTAVVLYKVENGAHTWPGSIINFPGTSYDFNASVEVWRFLSQYRLPDIFLATPTIPNSSKNAVVAFPNPCQDRQLGLALPKSYTKNSVNVSIQDLCGKIVFQQNIPVQKHRAKLQLHELTKGIYQICIRLDDLLDRQMVVFVD